MTNKNVNQIKMFAMDVDGTLTDGKIYIGENGEVFKAFNVKDGLGIKLLLENNIIPVIITGRNSNIVKYRASELGIKEVYQGVEDKLFVLQEITEKYSIKPSEIAYIGDDLNDLDIIQKVGVSFAPIDACRKIRECVTYVSKFKGGDGAVRQCIERILKYNKI